VWEEVTEAPLNVSGVLKALEGPKKRDVKALREPLERAAMRIFEEERRAGAMPPRSELRDKLDDIAATANKLAKLVIDPAVLNAEPEIYTAFGALEGLDVPMAMARLVKFAEDAMRQIPEGAGRTTAAPAYGRFGGQLLCACVIAQRGTAFTAACRTQRRPAHKRLVPPCGKHRDRGIVLVLNLVR
jgi:hypothetical protein